MRLPALEQEKALADAAFDEKERSTTQKRRESSAAYTAARAQEALAVTAERERDDAQAELRAAIAALASTTGTQADVDAASLAAAGKLRTATDIRAEAARLAALAHQAKAAFDAERALRDRARDTKVEAERKLVELRQHITDGEQENQRLKLAREAAERELQQAEQQAAQIRALDPTPTGAATPPDASLLTGDAAANIGTADNFTPEQVTLIVDTLKRELSRPGNWGENFHHELSPEGDKITFDNRHPDGSANAKPLKIIVHPRVIDIKGSMDDKTIQAALITANAMWGEAGLHIKTWNPWLKSRILANAEHLHQIGKIQKYKTKTLFGTVGAGFKDAKGEVARPSSTWTLGMPGSTYNHRLDCIKHGLESTCWRPTKWYKLGFTKTGVSAAARATT